MYRLLVLILMSSGTLQYVLVCRPSPRVEARSELDVKLCPPSGIQHFKIKTVQAHLYTAVHDPAAHAQRYDIAQGGCIWLVAFSTVLGLYALSAHLGAVLSFIRR
jgi:hypothetical protein